MFWTTLWGTIDQVPGGIGELLDGGKGDDFLMIDNGGVSLVGGEGVDRFSTD